MPARAAMFPIDDASQGLNSRKPLRRHVRGGGLDQLPRTCTACRDQIDGKSTNPRKMLTQPVIAGPHMSRRRMRLGFRRLGHRGEESLSSFSVYAKHAIA
jgi:hypothetical protein